MISLLDPLLQSLFLTQTDETSSQSAQRSSTNGSRAGTPGLGLSRQSTWRRSVDGNSSPEDNIDIGSNDEEDEFGLPSMTGLRWKSKSSKGAKEQSSRSAFTGTLKPTPSYLQSRSQRNSEDLASAVLSTGDIAEERDIPTYPNAPKHSSQKILQPQYKELLRDPASSLHITQPAPLPQNSSQKECDEYNARINRLQKFRRLLQEGNINMNELRELAWSGIPTEVRAMTWQLLLGYLPTKADRRVTILERKRQEYLEGVRQAFDEKSTMTMTNPTSARRSGNSDGCYRGLDETVWHQITIDVPRTNPHLELYGFEATKRSLERILYVWAIRHPASGYVQGINDLVTPFWQVFLGMYITDNDVESGMDPGQLPKPVIDAVEADTFWCLTKLLDGIQDNYIRAQPGIQRQVRSLQDLTTRIDRGLADHLKSEGVEFMQFTFRWMNCLLMREISVKSTIRMWDTYLVSLCFFIVILSMMSEQRTRLTSTTTRPKNEGFQISICTCVPPSWSSGRLSS